MSTADPEALLDLIISRDHRALGRQRRPSDVIGQHRVRRGVFVDQDRWDGADALARYRARIDAVAATRLRRIVFSHQTAAVLLGVPLLGPPPHIVHATTSPLSRRRTRAGIGWHHLDLDHDDVDTVGGLEATSLRRTALDLARTTSFAAAVVSLDAVVSDTAEGVAPPERWDSSCGRVPRADLRAHLDRFGGSPGVRRAAVALAFADSRSESVGESLSRVQLHAWGFPAPDLQVPVVGRSGARYVADFAWDGGRLLGEFDGRVKYAAGEVRGSASADDVVWAEKRREDDLRAAGHLVVRWTWADALDGTALADILQSSGLSHSGRHPRPVFTKGNS